MNISGAKIIAVALIFAAAGCMAEFPGVPAGTFAFRLGFTDGCDSGYHSGGNTTYQFRKDTARFADDADYKRGWIRGFGECQRRLQNPGEFWCGFSDATDRDDPCKSPDDSLPPGSADYQ